MPRAHHNRLWIDMEAGLLSLCYTSCWVNVPRRLNPPISKSLEYLELFEHRRKLENYSQETVQTILENII